MRRITIPLLFFLTVPLSLLSREKAPEILILHSYHPDMLWESAIRKSLSIRIRAAYPKARLHSEFMDLKQHGGEPYLGLVRNILTAKYRHKRLDAIAALDDGAYRFLIRFRDRIFGRVPVVFCGVNHYNPDPPELPAGMTGIVETVDIAGTVRLIRRLQPSLRTLYIVNDDTLTGRQNRKLLPTIPSGVQIRLLRHIPMDTLRQMLRRLGKKEAVLLLSFTSDSRGRTFTYRESIAAVRSASGAPVYGVWDFFLGRGIVGGSITSGPAQGEAAAGMLLRILRGENPDSIPVLRGTVPVATVDYREAKQQGLDPDRIDGRVRFINRERDNLALSRSTLILLVFLVSGGLAVSLLLLCRLRIQKKRGRAAEEGRTNYRILSGRLEKKVAERTRLLVQANETLRGSLDELEKEADAARRIQFQLLPRNETVINGVLFRHLLLPSRYVSGDFLNCFRIDETRVGFYIADVSGHGLSAAFITVFLKGQMELQLEKYRTGTGGLILEPDGLLSCLNRTILDQDLGKHVSLFYAVLDTRENSLDCSSAGQYPFPYLLRKGELTIVDMKSPPLGVFSGSKYYTRRFPMEPHARMTVFSDGILEVLPSMPLLDKEQKLKELVEKEDGSLLYYSGMLESEDPPALADDVTILLVSRSG